MLKDKILAFDIGATWIRMALMSIDGKLIYNYKEPTTQEKNPNALSQQVISMINNIGGKYQLDKICGIGIGSVGPLNSEQGYLEDVTNFTYKGIIPLVDPLEKEFGINTFLDNDCAVAVRGEKHFGYGKNKDIKNLVYVTISTGIGGGAYVDGRVLSGNAAEIGHFIVEHENPLQCGCRQYGCWEAYCSGTGIANFVKKEIQHNGDSIIWDYVDGNVEKITSKHVYYAAKQEDEFALNFLEKVNKYNLIGFNDITVAYAPEAIVVGGSIALNNEALVLDPVRKKLDTLVGKPHIVLSKLGDDVVLYGAAALVKEKLNL